MVDRRGETTPVVVGRSPADVEKLGLKGAVLLGKIYAETAEKLVLGNKIYLDVAGAHSVLICGKRGGGKSYTMGVIAEGFSLLDEEVRKNLNIILLDTMGIYWTMGHANQKEKDLLEPYGMTPRPVEVKIYTPEKYYYEYKKKGIRTDVPFSIEAHVFTPDDWIMAFHQGKYSENGLYISKIVTEIEESKARFTVQDILNFIDADKETDKLTKAAVKNMFETAEGWGVFSDHGTPIEDLAKGGQISILDVSCYVTMPGGWDVKSLVVGVVARHLFVSRMQSRKVEEVQEIRYIETYFTETTEAAARKQEMPIVWLVIDEAHEFLPRDEKDNSAATQPMITIMREGRQPGISLILATQQPGKIHTDVMTQADIVISHRVTARMDVQALGLLAQSYLEHGVERAMNNLPHDKGTAVLFDDANEKIYQIRVRPRLTWHGGSSPTAVKE
ncbi:ATP-binding protein [Candidatus Woesearchaeota archaeon]|nr:ATP-binding protein [Candidatus Woesearchaeota archaeon]